MNFTTEQLDEAIKSVNDKYSIDGGHFEIAREKYHEETLRFFREVFFVDEPVNSSLQLEWNKEIEAFVMHAIQQNLSLIAVDDTTGEIMGIRISAPTNKDEKIDPSTFKEENLKKLFHFFEFVNNNVDFYSRYGVTEAVEFVALAVSRKYRQRGLGRKLMEAAVDLLRYFKPENAYVKSIATSNYSAIIFEKVGFEKTFEIQYKDYIVDGEVILNNTGVHKRAVAFALKL